MKPIDNSALHARLNISDICSDVSGVFIINKAASVPTTLLRRIKLARYSRMQTLNAMYESGLVIVFYHPDAQVAVDVVKACAEGGARLIEFTNRGDSAIKVFSAIEDACVSSMKDVITGVGSIVEEGTASLYINYGANFVVGPTLNQNVARLCNRRKIPYSPGCGSASEISLAEELGCEIVKMFPGEQVGGPGFVKALKGPCPWTSIMPTGGVDTSDESLNEWFKAGIVCAGIGSQLITREMLDKHDYAAMAASVRSTLVKIQKIKQGKGQSK